MIKNCNQIKLELVWQENIPFECEILLPWNF